MSAFLRIHYLCLVSVLAIPAFGDSIAGGGWTDGSTAKRRYSSSQSSWSGGNGWGGWGSTGSGVRHAIGSCNNLIPQIEQVAPGQGKCYAKLFAAEGPCSTSVRDGAAANNPYAGHGLCSIETSPKIRAMNRRGPDCENVGFSDTMGQIRCCVSLMRTTKGHYFGPVMRGEVSRCH